MTTANIRKGMAKGCTACMVFLCLWVMVPGAWAAYEVNQGSITANVLTNTATRWTDNLTVQWTAPDMTGADALNGYIYKWNNSSSPLDDTVFNANTGRDGIVDPSATPPNVVKSGTDLAALDSGDLLYLHIKTWYLLGSSPAYSSDVVYGPFMIDNVAPTGTVRIVDASGNNDVTSTSDTIVYLKLAASKDPVKMYLSETSTKPATGVPFSVDAVYGLGNTAPSPPDKTIYAWFEDIVGNVSSTPATDSFTLLAPINISPNTATIDIAISANQVFRVEGTTDSYTWAISDPTVAGFNGGINTGNEVTVKALKVGTFTLTATKSGSPDLTSGTIRVVQGYTKGDVNNDGGIDAGDAILILRYSVSLITLTDTQKAAGNCTNKADNNLIDSGDAIKILRYSVQLIPTL